MTVTATMHDGIDWIAGEQDFVQNTPPTVGFREYCKIAAGRSWTGYQEIPYQRMKDYGKEKLWMTKRAKWLRDNNPSLSTDLDISYQLVMSKIVDEGERLTVSELTGLIGQQIRLAELKLAEQSPLDESDRDFVTRDEVLDIAEKYEPLSPDELLQRSLDKMLAVESEVDAEPEAD